MKTPKFPHPILAFLVLLLTFHPVKAQNDDTTENQPSVTQEPDQSDSSKIDTFRQERLFGKEVLLLSLHKDPENGNQYRFAISVEADPDKKAEFHVRDIGLDQERLEIFLYRFYKAYFEKLYPPNPPKPAVTEQQNTEGSPPPSEATPVTGDSNLLKNVETAAQALSAEDQEMMKGIAEQLIAQKKAAREKLRLDLRKLATSFLQEAVRRENRGMGEASGAIFSSVRPLGSTLLESYRTNTEYLHRKSVEIGRQIYTLAVKEVTLLENDTTFVFELSLGNESQFFEIESIRANAHTISIMAQKMRNTLDNLIRSRIQQLPNSYLQRMTTIANQLSIDPNSLNSQDREFLRSSIRGAADQYGFDAQKLREELKKTGLLKDDINSPANALSATRTEPVIPIEDWVREATVTYTEFIDNLDTELRDIASDFLFVAYLNTIRVESNELKIGSLKANPSINLYRKKLTYGNDKIAIPPSKDPSEYFPVAKVKVSKVRIEFENEQINNIEVTATKQGKPNYSLLAQAIDNKQEFLYLKLLDRIFKIPIREGQFKGAGEPLDMISGDNDTSFSVTVNDPDLGNLGQLTLVMYDFNTNFKKTEEENEKDKKKKTEKQISTVSFRFHLLFFVGGPPTAPSEEQVKTYTNKYLVGDKPRGFDVGIYLDQKGDRVLKTFRNITPHLVMAASMEKLSYDGNVHTLKFELDGAQVQNLNLIPYGNIYSNVVRTYMPRVIEEYSFKDRGLNVTIPIAEEAFTASTDKSPATDIIEEGEQMIFQNQFPISYSTKGDVTFYLTGNRKKLSRPLFAADNLHFIELHEAITNEVQFYNNTENYSPRNSVIEINNVSDAVPIYKEAATQILKAKIFSDFQGFDETTPNGLVQTEVSKRFFLNTTSTRFLSNAMYNGYINYVEPMLVLSKLEDQNKYLPLRSGVAIRQVNENALDTSTVDYVSSMEILNYSNLSVGTNLGLAYYGVPSLHLRFQLGLGAYIHQSGFSTTSTDVDSLTNQRILTTNEFNGNSLVYYPEFRLEFNPDPRFGLHVAWRPTSVLLLSNDVSQVDNEPEFLMTRRIANNRKRVHQFQLFAFIQVSRENSGEFFMRTNFNVAGDDRNNNFLQLQLGYAFNIFARDKQTEKQQPPPTTAAGAQ